MSNAEDERKLDDAADEEKGEISSDEQRRDENIVRIPVQWCAEAESCESR